MWAVQPLRARLTAAAGPGRRVGRMHAGPGRRVVRMQAVSGKIVPAVIVGGGRVGQALLAMGDGNDVMRRRGQPIPAEDTGPIIVCTRNDDLDAVVSATPESRRNDFVFIQNGMLEPWLETNGLTKTTQLLVYFAVAKAGDKPKDGVTDTDPGGLTAVHGKWATAVADRLHHGGLSCEVMEAGPFRARMFEKLIWISSFMLVGACHGGCTVGDVERVHRAEVLALIDELSAACGVSFAPRLGERLCAYARSVAHFPTAVKERKWRNGYFESLSRSAATAGRPDPCPLHTALMARVS